MADCTCSCGKTFAAGWRALEQHREATGHGSLDYECDRCTRRFKSTDACWDHMMAKNHFKYECTLCYETWDSVETRTEHEHDEHFYCEVHDREFDNRNSLDQHLKSRAHLGANMKCPFCARGFTTAAGVTHHIESGSCPNASQLDRDKLYKLVRSKDSRGVLTKNLIGWTGSSTYEATSAAWNGNGFECYLCHREFSSQAGLTQHLNSPIHQEKLYHCPKASCGREFVSLAALFNHLESESCGYAKFAAVQKSFSDIIDPSRRITL